MDNLEKLKQGYAAYLDIPSNSFNNPGFSIIASPKRQLPVWGQWVIPIWALSIGSAVVCCVAPRFILLAEKIFTAYASLPLTDPCLLGQAYLCADPEGWGQYEVYYYPYDFPPQSTSIHEVIHIQPGTQVAEKLPKEFTGGVYAIYDQTQNMLSSAGIKDYGLVNEIAVGTHPGFRRQGLGKATVSRATQSILVKGNVPVYIPDTLTNTASYVLANSLGFVKAGEMMMWEIELARLEGIPQNQ